MPGKAKNFSIRDGKHTLRPLVAAICEMRARDLLSLQDVLTKCNQWLEDCAFLGQYMRACLRYGHDFRS